LKQHFHNNMRITRMLTSCSQLDFKKEQLAILNFFIHECFAKDSILSSCIDATCRNYWVNTLEDDEERTAMEELIKELIAAEDAAAAEAETTEKQEAEEEEAAEAETSTPAEDAPAEAPPPAETETPAPEAVSDCLALFFCRCLD